MMRNVFLTGGSRGIGAAAVLALARAGPLPCRDVSAHLR